MIRTVPLVIASCYGYIFKLNCLNMGHMLSPIVKWRNLPTSIHFQIQTFLNLCLLIVQLFKKLYNNDNIRVGPDIFLAGYRISG